jgi:hypothetical protein
MIRGLRAFFDYPVPVEEVSMATRIRQARPSSARHEGGPRYGSTARKFR